MRFVGTSVTIPFLKEVGENAERKGLVLGAIGLLPNRFDPFVGKFRRGNERTDVRHAGVLPVSLERDFVSSVHLAFGVENPVREALSRPFPTLGRFKTFSSRKSL